MEEIFVVASSYRARPPAFPSTPITLAAYQSISFSLPYAQTWSYIQPTTRDEYGTRLYTGVPQKALPRLRSVSFRMLKRLRIWTRYIAETVIRCRNRDGVCSSRCKRLCNQDDWKEEIDTARHKNM